MSKEIDLIKCIISEIDDNLYSDFGCNPCIRYTPNLKKLLLALDTPDVRHFFENCNNQAQHITDLEAKLAESESKVKVKDYCHSTYQRIQLDYDKLKNDYDKKVKLLSEIFDNKRKLQFEFYQLKQQLAEKDKEISQLYPFVKEHNNGNFIEYNVVYEKNGIVATTTFGRNKEMAYDYLKLLKKGK